MAMLEVKSVLNLLGTPVSYPYAVTAGPWIGVTQQRLDNSNIGTTLEQVGREAVAQRVQRHGLLDPGRLVKQAAQLAGGHRLAALVAGKQLAIATRNQLGKIFGALIEEVRFAADSPVEEAGCRGTRSTPR